MNCVFCRIINGEIPSYMIFEDDLIAVFLDVNPVNPGHVLIVPKKHTQDILSIDDDTLMRILNKSKEIANLLIDKLGADGFSLVQNNGIAQEVKHFHLHVIPKYKKKVNLDIKSVYDKLTR